MYSILTALGVAIAVGLGGAVLGWWAWTGGILLGLLALVATWILIMRRYAKRLQPAMVKVKQLAESGKFALASDCIEGELLPLAPWVPNLGGQLNAQLGTLAHYAGNADKAMTYLEAAPNRVGEAKMLLASLLFQKKEPERAVEVLVAAAPSNKKSTMFYNVAAWIMQKCDRSRDAMALLSRYLKKDEGNAPTRENLLRLQNGKKLTMKPFGMEWYALGLERPPASMMQAQQGPGAAVAQPTRKGFRQPPKRRKG